MNLGGLAALLAFVAAPLSASENLDALLEEQRARLNFPGLAALVLKNEAVHAEGAAGVRKSGSPERLTVHDKFHIGSDTKAMTATLAAMLVEQRLAYLRQVATRPPEHFPGARYLYSNAGYIMAGAMLERATGRAWEDLMREMLFAPLGIQSCGFGPPAQKDGVVDNPWGHTRQGSGFKAYNLDNAPYLGPAGTVHCTLQDYARFALLHMRKDRLLRQESFARLQSPPADESYALGWIVVARGWAGGLALNHNGSNTINFFCVWLAPARGFGVIAATNLGGDGVAQQIDEVVSELVRRYR